MSFLTSVSSVILLMCLALPGFILSKAKMLPDNLSIGLVNVLLFVVMPSLSISNFLKTDFSTGLITNLGLVVIFGFFFLISSYLLARFFFIKFKENPSKGVCVAAVFLTNCSFMGIPVIQTFFPNNPEPILYIAMFLIPMNVLTWTLLVYSITGNKKYIRLKAALLNPGFITLVISITLVVLKIDLPKIVLRVFEYFGSMNTPLAMIIVGIRFADIKFRELLTSAKVFYSSFLKLVIVPLFTFGVLMLARHIFPMSTMVATTLFIAMAMPSGNFVIVFSEKFNGDRQTAAKCVLLSTLLSLVTIPFMMMLIRYF